MEAPVLGLGEEQTTAVVGEDLSSSTSSCGTKLVPWLSWDEWEFVRESLFSSSSNKRDGALRRILAWRSRGSLPVVIDVTSSIVEIQQTDPHFRGDQPSDVVHSEQMLAMLYCMAILRLVNCVVEKTRKKSELSIAEAADAIGIPRSLIDVRHEGSHRHLPALPLVRDSSVKALRWLKSYYWEPQKRLIPFQRDDTANIRKEIKAKFRELALCLRVKQNPQPGPSIVKGKHCGRNKFLSLMAGKPRGYKKQFIRTLKTLVQLYSSFSSEVVSVLLEFLLKASDSSYSVELPKHSQVEKTRSLLDDWKLVITKFSNKEPELLLTLLTAILDMIKTQEAMKYEMGRQYLTSSEHETETGQIDCLSCLFAWLVGQLKGLKPLLHNDSASAEIRDSLAGKHSSNAILRELLRKCLLVSASGNDQLMNSALLLAQLMGDNSLVEKLSKLYGSWTSNSDIIEENISLTSSQDLSQHEESIRQAAKELELVKLRRMKSKVDRTTDGNVEKSSRWAVAKSWNPCPIGMLPRALSSSGRLPTLDCDEDHESVNKSSKGRKNWELNRSSGDKDTSSNIQLLDNSNMEKMTGKRAAAPCDTQSLDNPNFKKMRETVEWHELAGEEALSSEGVKADGEEDSFASEGIKGRLKIRDVYKKVGEEELLNIKASSEYFSLVI